MKVYGLVAARYDHDGYIPSNTATQEAETYGRCDDDGGHDEKIGILLTRATILLSQDIG
ncbi:MAG: hypothetical protein AVDCRST_MAG93-8127 [uncultured Chloroflexia bacterium]|uniref:Uncharacterized protein n=1 Tax=uncultured Chloroflexia bacterium TaxID=1672391 RepID=A0A6J4MSS9_9CHLR|nr:MAG: hypothetical protein AVDCRST_MAG93-8127 [uncultured Chloroflexia bacterium]